MRVKVCGIKRIEDAVMAAHCGTDAIGLLVGQRHRSEDFIDADLAREIAKNCPPYVTPVLVTHLEDPQEIARLASYTGVAAVQLHTDCDVKSIRVLRSSLPYIKIIKNFHATGPEVIAAMHPFEPVVDAFILDTPDPVEDRVGGTGITHDWNISRDIVRAMSRPVILAGGLDPENVAAAIRIVNPFGVDANSRLKDASGFKDQTKVADFVYRTKLEFFMIRREKSGRGIFRLVQSW